MSYFPDLNSVSYSGLRGDVRAVGWLEHPHEFPKGPVDKEFFNKLWTLLERPLAIYSHFGLHYCSLCTAEGRVGPDARTSQYVLFVPSDTRVYEAPIWIGHYIHVHEYLPPQEFRDAVTSSPAAGTGDYLAALIRAVPEFNGGVLDFMEFDAKKTLEPSAEHGDEVPLIEKMRQDAESAPSREELINQLIDEAGGLSNECCAWADCENQALLNTVVCVEHKYADILQELTENSDC